LIKPRLYGQDKEPDAVKVVMLVATIDGLSAAIVGLYPGFVRFIIDLSPWWQPPTTIEAQKQSSIVATRYQLFLRFFLTGKIGTGSNLTSRSVVTTRLSKTKIPRLIPSGCSA
jgi:hypothetical protein